MANGIPLTDEDRYPWLLDLIQAVNNTQSQTVIFTCSALKKSYRDIIRKQVDPKSTLVFVFLYSDPDTIIARVSGRAGHYMKTDMVESQLKIMEIPNIKEEKNVILVGPKLQSLDAFQQSKYILDNLASFEQ